MLIWMRSCAACISIDMELEAHFDYNIKVHNNRIQRILTRFRLAVHF